MNLADWLTQTRTRRYELAERIGVRPSMITDYCQGKVWPGRDKIEAIVRETGGAVTANDFLSSAATDAIAQAGAAQ